MSRLKLNVVEVWSEVDTICQFVIVYYLMTFINDSIDVHTTLMKENSPKLE